MPTEHYEIVSLEQVRDEFLNDRKMYLSRKLSEIYYIEIYHAEYEDKEAASDECEIILLVGTEDMFEADECITLRSDSFPSLDKVIEAFQLDVHKVVWAIDKD